MIRLRLAAEGATIDGATRERLTQMIDIVEGAFEEVRAVSHGLYPPELLDQGSSLRCIRSSDGLRRR